MIAWKKPMMLIIAALAATLPESALAGEWRSRSRADDCSPGTLHARAEWAAPFRQAKCLEYLDCGGLSAYAEATRHAENARYLSIYQRPILVTSSATASALPTMEPPALAPPPPASTPVFPGPGVR